MAVENKQYSQILKIKTISGQNITEINKTLIQNQQFLIPATDIIKANTIRTIWLEMKITLPYPCKTTQSNQHCNYYRYTIQGKLQTYQYQNINCYVLATQQAKKITMLVFDAKQYPYKKSLLVFLKEVLTKGIKQQSNQIENLWIQMHKYPQNPIEMYTSCRLVHDLDCINKQLIIGQMINWSDNCTMKTGVNYKLLPLDLKINKPFGLAIIYANKIIIYGSIIQ